MARPLSRREFLAGSGALLVLAACTKASKQPPTPGPGTIADLQQGATKLSLISTESPVKPGLNYFGFDLVTANGQVVTGGKAQVYLSLHPSDRAAGPFDATFYPFTDAYERFRDTSPKTELPGTYAAQLDVPSPGNWTVAVSLPLESGRGVGTAKLPVETGPIPAEVGAKAVSVPTPVATTMRGLEEICTRRPPDSMHYISLDHALASGKPTVVTFATPLLCESRLCGPVVDEQLAAFSKIGQDRANFIHVEEFLPGSDLKPPAPTFENTSPAFKAYGFQSEPWTLLIDGHGIIRGRFEGPLTEPQIAAALQPLL
jgi:hypothetical protein